MKRVVITGIGAVTAFGKEWSSVKAAFQRKQNGRQKQNGQNVTLSWALIWAPKF